MCNHEKATLQHLKFYEALNGSRPPHRSYFFNKRTQLATKEHSLWVPWYIALIINNVVVRCPNPKCNARIQWCALCEGFYKLAQFNNLNRWKERPGSKSPHLATQL